MAYRSWWLFVLLTTLCVVLAAQTSASKRPLALDEIEGLLKGGVSPRRASTLVEQYGVSFELTDALERKLRKLGADDKLLLVIAIKHVQPARSVQPVEQTVPPPPDPRPNPPAAKTKSTWDAAKPTWTDPNTGLMWVRASNPIDVNWNNAKNYCASLDLAGYSNWQLPTIDELTGLYDLTEGTAGCHIRGGIQFSGYCGSWSRSVEASSGEAWVIFFGNGRRSYGPVDSDYGGRALCVRYPAN